MAEWVRGEGPAEPTVFEAVEVRRNLPPSWLAVLPR
jgi:UDP-glucose 4-epimerase